jgi:hypothetical protein
MIREELVEESEKAKPVVKEEAKAVEVPKPSSAFSKRSIGVTKELTR